MSGQITRHFQITGLVQGVGFRYSMRAEAIQLGLSGWVRNRRDGSVEALAHGDAVAVEAISRWAQHGPRSARVDAVQQTDVVASDDCPTDFEEWPTC